MRPRAKVRFVVLYFSCKRSGLKNTRILPCSGENLKAEEGVRLAFEKLASIIWFLFQSFILLLFFVRRPV